MQVIAAELLTMIDIKKWQIKNGLIDDQIFNTIIESFRTLEQNVCNCYEYIRKINPFDQGNAKKITLQEEIASKLQGKIARFLEVELYHIVGMNILNTNQFAILSYHVGELGTARDVIKKCLSILKYYQSINSMVNTTSNYETNHINEKTSIQFSSLCTANDFAAMHGKN